MSRTHTATGLNNVINALRRRSWRTLCFLSGLEESLRRRFTTAGQMVLGGAFTGALFGVDTHKTLGVQIFGLGIGLLVIALIGSTWRRPRGIIAQRNLPRYATLGVPVQYRVLLKNIGAESVPFLFFQERLPDPRPNLTAFLTTPAPWEHRVNFLDRTIGYPRWRWLVRQRLRADKPPLTTTTHIMSGDQITLDLTLIPRRRGPLILSNLEAMRSDTLGLCWSRSSIAPPDRLLVLPMRYPVPPQHPPGQRRLQPGGVRLAAAVGDSQEFIGLRDYRPGDSPRHIHWAAWARSGIPVIKEYQDEYFSRQALILDSFVSLGKENAFEAAISVAASFVEPLQHNDSLLDLMFIADKAYTLTSGRGLLSSEALFEVLACIEPQAGNFDSLTSAVLQHAHLINACLCVFLNWDASRQNLVKNLKALGLPVRVLVMEESAITAYGTMADCPQNLHNINPNKLASELARLC